MSHPLKKEKHTNVLSGSARWGGGKKHEVKPWGEEGLAWEEGHKSREESPGRKNSKGRGLSRMQYKKDSQQSEKKETLLGEKGGKKTKKTKRERG